MAAIRECFEESGILLARTTSSPSYTTERPYISLNEQERNEGRKAVHAEEIDFVDWLASKGGVADVDGLYPFTRWLTPGNLPKRYSTQMYLYFLPLRTTPGAGDVNNPSRHMHVPTADGGIEHTAAEFRYAQEWIDASLRHEVQLFPPQFFLLSLVAQSLSAPPVPAGDDSQLQSTAALREQREQLIKFIKEDGDPPWGEKCISPDPVKREEQGRYLIMGLGNPGPELEGSGRQGDLRRIIRIEQARDIERGRQRPVPKEVAWREEVVGDSVGKEKL